MQNKPKILGYSVVSDSDPYSEDTLLATLNATMGILADTFCHGVTPYSGRNFKKSIAFARVLKLAERVSKEQSDQKMIAIRPSYKVGSGKLKECLNLILSVSAGRLVQPEIFSADPVAIKFRDRADIGLMDGKIRDPKARDNQLTAATTLGYKHLIVEDDGIKSNDWIIQLAADAQKTHTQIWVQVGFNTERGVTLLTRIPEIGIIARCPIEIAEKMNAIRAAPSL